MPDSLAGTELFIVINSLPAAFALCEVIRAHVRDPNDVAAAVIWGALDRGAGPGGADAGAVDEGLAVGAEEEALLAGVAEEALWEVIAALAAVEAVEVVVLRPHDLVQQVARKLVAVRADDVRVCPGRRLHTPAGRLYCSKGLCGAHFGHVVIIIVVVHG